MEQTLTSILLVFSAVSCLALAVVVLAHNHRRRTHWAFAALALSLMLWALGVLAIIHSHTRESAEFWIRATFIVACCFPPAFYQFIGLLPRGHFVGSRAYLLFNYAALPILVALSFTPWYIVDIQVMPHGRPEVVYGPVFLAYVAVCIVMFVVMHANLVTKWRTAMGLERRQVEHALLGIFSCVLLGTATNMVLPALKVYSLQPYGPVFIVLMMGTFAYAMVRYHLLDIWVIVSRATVYAIATAFIIASFFGSITLVHWALRTAGRAREVYSTVLAAIVVALVLQPLKERVQLLLERTVLKRRYDTSRLFARISRNAATTVRLDHLLRTVVDDIGRTVGVQTIRALLVDEKEPATLVVEYSTVPEEIGSRLREHEPLLKYVGLHPDPIVLEEVLHSRPTEELVRMAKHLADLDAHLCLPLKTTSGLVGILALGPKTTGDMYSGDDLVVFGALGGPIAAAVENARLYHKLEEVNVHLSRVLSNMRGGVIAVDSKGKVTTVNQGAVDLLGPMKLGQAMETLPEEVARILRYTLLERQGIADFETVIEAAEGKRATVAISSSCLTTTDGQSAGAMALVYDLSQVKRLEENVQRAERLSSIGTLAAGMAHEIKNPLVSIKTFTQLLLRRYDDPDFRTTFFDVVPHEVERIDAIVSQLLESARPKPVHFATCNICTIIDQVLTLVENQTRKATVTVETAFPEEPIEVYGDEQQLHQVFLNLVLNAIDSLRMTNGGLLRVSAGYGRMRPQRQAFGKVEELDCVRVEVSDTGQGIPAEHLDHIFTPFFTTKANGSGLGLAVVHGIVTEHGGEVDVRNAPGRGATFVVTLPLARSVSTVENTWCRESTFP